MSIQTLVEKIKEKGNPTVAGLDARLEYIPQHISGRNMMLHGETLRAAAESVVAFNCGLIDVGRAAEIRFDGPAPGPWQSLAGLGRRLAGWIGGRGDQTAAR